MGSIPGLGGPLEEGMALTPVLLPGESHGQRTWWTIVHGVANKRLEQLSTHAPVLIGIPTAKCSQNWGSCTT